MSAARNRDESYEVDTSSPFYFNTSHWRAVDGMLEGVKERAGLMVLTGPGGSGKTMIMRAISEGLEDNTPGLFLQYASLNFREFVNFLHSSLKVEDEVMDAPNKAVALREYLYIQAKRNETGVVFIDEAHNLEPDVLKMLPKLARFDTLEDGRAVGLQFILIGSDDLNDTLEDPEFAEARSKVLIRHELRFFTRGELKQFLTKRLAPIARMTDEPITEGGIEAMGKYTGGSPRLIGMICSHTMLFAAENPGQSIDAKMVEEAAEALMLKPVENPFASEADDPQAASGPFSEADMSDEKPRALSESEPAAPPAPFSDTQTVYADDNAPDADDISGMEDRVEHDSEKESDTLDTDDVAEPSLYADDHAAVADIDSGRDETAEEFDSEAFDHALDESEKLDDDFDDEFDDDDFDDLDDDDDLLADDPKKKSVTKGGTSFLQRLGWGGPKKKEGQPAKILGASRKREREEPLPAPEKRKTRTSVAGDKERKVKMAGMVAGVVVLLGGAYAAHKPVLGMISGFMQKDERIAAAPAVPETVAETFVPESESGRIAVTGAEPANSVPNAAQPVTVTVENSRSPVSGGWGAKVVVERDVEGNKLAIPKPAVDFAAGALGVVDRVLAVGERNAGDGIKGVLSAASDQVAGLRGRLQNKGLTSEQAIAKATTLVSQGDQLLAEKRYITPAGSSAYDSYREALALEPDNERAKDGIRTLREHFAKKAEGARDARQWESANTFFETAIAISNLRPVN